MISRNNGQRSDVVLAFITSKLHTATMPDSLPIQPSMANGLKAPSVVRFDKIVTLETRVIAGKLGDAEPASLSLAAPVFFGVFGFGNP